MKTYKLETWKLKVEGEFETEEEAIKELSDRYMRCSKCDPPHEGVMEGLLQKNFRTLDTIAKGVFLSVKEEVYGHSQFILKHELVIYPFKKEHWWESSNGFEFEECEFKYEIN